MTLEPVSLQNAIILQEFQKYGFEPISASKKSPQDTVIISNKKEENNNTLKYTLIGAGVLAGLVALLKHKDIIKIFSKNTLPAKNYIQDMDFTTPLVPLEKLIDDFGRPFIADCSEGYQLWHFVSADFLNKFLAAHQDLSEFLKKSGLNEYGRWYLEYIKEVAQSGEIAAINLVKAIKQKTGVDLCGEFKHYRFIGQSELDVIKAGKDVARGRYITLSPNGGGKYNVPPFFDYRITFENTENIVKHLSLYHDMEYKAWTRTPYTYKDVEKVERLVDGKWQEVDFLPEH